MKTSSVDFEDHLIPIAVCNNEIILFNKLDGAVYKLGNQYSRYLEDLPPYTFAVPGDDYIYSLKIQEFSIQVKYIRISISETSVRDIAISETVGVKPIAIVPHLNNRYIVLRRNHNHELEFIPLNGGCSFMKILPFGAVPLFISPEGSVVYQKGEFWGISNKENELNHGFVTSWSSNGFTVVTDPKGQRKYNLISNDEKRTLKAPEGWEIRQAITYQSNIFLVCINPHEGYALWDGLNLRKIVGTVIAYPMGNS